MSKKLCQSPKKHPQNKIIPIFSPDAETGLKLLVAEGYCFANVALKSFIIN